jgi:flagellar export protein FliJ
MSLWRKRSSSSTRWPARLHEPGVMKNFAFPLARVMDWRRTQVRIEETALEILQVELHGIETRLAETRAARAQAVKTPPVGGSVTGAELSALDRFRKAAAVECVKLAEVAAESRRRIASQLQVVIRKRRDLRLLEKLRQHKLDAWKADLEREIDREAAELHLVSHHGGERRKAGR